MEAFRQDGDGDGEGGGADVGWDRHDLGLGGGVAEFFDDGGLERRGERSGFSDMTVTRERERTKGCREVGAQLTRKRDRVYNGKLMVWKPRPYSQHLGSRIALETLCQEKASSRVASLSDLSRL